MAVRERVPWRRLVAESTAIMASILIALTVDSSWAEHQERIREGEIIEALLVEFESKKGGLERAQERGERQKAALLRVLQADPFELRSMPLEEAAQLTDVFSVSAFDPVEAELSAILVSGELGLIQSAELRRALSNWDRLVQGSKVQASYSIDRTLKLMEAFEGLGGMYEVAATWYESDQTPNLAGAWAAAAEDPSFRNAAATTLLVKDTYHRDDLSSLRAAMSTVLGLLKALEDD